MTSDAGVLQASFFCDSAVARGFFLWLLMGSYARAT